METAIAYIRVSTGKQDLGLDAQRAQITAWAERNDVTILEWFVEAGVSGAAELEDREVLFEAMAAVEAKKANLFLVACRDRLARDVLNAIIIEQKVQRHGGRVFSVDGMGNGGTPTDQFMRTIMDAVAQLERQTIALRIRAALKAKKARGETNSIEKITPPETIKLIHDLRRQGYSQRELIKKLEEMCILSPKGRTKWCRHTIERVLKLPTPKVDFGLDLNSDLGQELTFNA